MRLQLLSAAGALTLAACSPGGGGAGKAPALAVEAAPARAAATLEVSSPAFPPSGDIPQPYSAFGERRSPPLAWTAGPAGTSSYALIVQDPDAPAPKPFVHWIVFDISSGVTSIQANTVPPGALLGNNSAGSASWFAPAPPPGPAHRYHFQVFALDTTLGLKEGAGRDEVVDAMKGHVLASGDLVGRYKVG
jgi:Raf kinase inhibitor-like YbhB/YbcL family protein